MVGRRNGSSKRFELIDFVVPVPLHPEKERKRGYNQVHSFAKSLAIALNADLKLTLLRKERTAKHKLQKTGSKG